VVITVYEDKSFEFVIKTPPAAIQLMDAAKIKGGSGEPNKKKIGKLTREDLEAIYELKKDDLNANDKEAAFKIIAGTARNMGVDVAL